MRENIIMETGKESKGIKRKGSLFVISKGNIIR